MEGKAAQSTRHFSYGDVNSGASRDASVPINGETMEIPMFKKKRTFRPS